MPLPQWPKHRSGPPESHPTGRPYWSQAPAPEGQVCLHSNVTDPSAFSASDVMWEFTHADDADLGYVVGRPKIVKLRTSAPNATTPTYRWFAMVASGVNNYVPDSAFGGTYSSTGKPALFLLALDKPAGEAWTAAGTSPNYYKISLPIDATAKYKQGNGSD
jgi:type IV pilus assembly protein PilY1